MYKLYSHLTCFQQGFIAQLVEHHTGIAEVNGFESRWSLRIVSGLYLCIALYQLKLIWITNTVKSELIQLSLYYPQINRADFLNAVYFRRGLTCTLGLTNNLIDSGQPRSKPHLRKVKPNHVLKTVFTPQLATVYQVFG